MTQIVDSWRARIASPGPIMVAATVAAALGCGVWAPPASAALSGATLSIYAGNPNANGIVSTTPKPATSITNGGANDIAVDSATGTVYLADGGGLEQITSNDKESILIGETPDPTVAPPVDGPAAGQSFIGVEAVAVDSTTGDVYFSDEDKYICELSPSGMVTVLAGNGEQADSNGEPADSVPGPALNSPINDPLGLTVDPSSKDVYFTTGSDELDQITPSGQLNSIVSANGFMSGLPSLNAPWDVAFDDATGNLYVAENGSGEVAEVNPQTDAVTTIAGDDSTSNTPATPGPATVTALGNTLGVAVDPSSGDVYVSDGWDVDRINAAGILSHVVGNGKEGTPTPGPATGTSIDNAEALAFDPTQGTLYVADTHNGITERVGQAQPAAKSGSSTPGSGAATVSAPKTSGSATTVSASCPTKGPSCTVKLQLLIHVAHIKAPVPAGSTTVTLRAGQHKSATVTLDAAGRRVLSQDHGRLSAQLEVTRQVASSSTPTVIATRAVHLTASAGQKAAKPKAR